MSFPGNAGGPISGLSAPGNTGSPISGLLPNLHLNAVAAGAGAGATANSAATTAIFYGVVAIGLVILSDYAPKLVNGLLALILIGLILRNSGAVQNWISKGVGAATPNKGQ